MYVSGTQDVYITLRYDTYIITQLATWKSSITV